MLQLFNNLDTKFVSLISVQSVIIHSALIQVVELRSSFWGICRLL